MPRWVASILDSSAVSLIGRVVLTFAFWSAGINKLLDWNGTLGEMAHFNLHPPAVIGAITIVVELLGPALVIWGPYYWLGAGALGVFTALTIPIAHPFWTMHGMPGQLEMYTAEEHVSIIGGLILVAVLRRRETARR